MSAPKNECFSRLKSTRAEKARGWNQNQFAEAMGKQPSEISKWLSGTHNFTAETLWDIEDQLGIELIALKEPMSKLIKLMEVHTEVSSPVDARNNTWEIYKLSTAHNAVDSDAVCYG
jgi:transcriptional regulator with XRE-family HTH domain